MLKFIVEDMTCGHCSAIVEKAVKGVDPTAAVTVDRATKTVAVESAASAAKIADAITAAGYPSRPAASV